MRNGRSTHCAQVGERDVGLGQVGVWGWGQRPGGVGGRGSLREGGVAVRVGRVGGQGVLDEGHDVEPALEPQQRRRAGASGRCGTARQQAREAGGDVGVTPRGGGLYEYLPQHPGGVGVGHSQAARSGETADLQQTAEEPRSRQPLEGFERQPKQQRTQRSEHLQRTRERQRRKHVHANMHMHTHMHHVDMFGGELRWEAAGLFGRACACTALSST